VVDKMSFHVAGVWEASAIDLDLDVLLRQVVVDFEVVVAGLDRFVSGQRLDVGFPAVIGTNLGFNPFFEGGLHFVHKSSFRRLALVRRESYSHRSDVHRDGRVLLLRGDSDR
jgi:hypothetical protein